MFDPKLKVQVAETPNQIRRNLNTESSMSMSNINNRKNYSKLTYGLAHFHFVYLWFKT